MKADELRAEDPATVRIQDLRSEAEDVRAELDELQEVAKGPPTTP